MRYFNRRRKRDGPLFRGRFRSRPVETLAYRRVLVSYIDGNPVVAGIVTHPEHYPYGSARSYLRGTGPDWLSRDWVESEVRAVSASGAFDPHWYSTRFSPRLPDSIIEWIERRMERGMVPGEDDFEHLLEAATPKIRDWAVRKAQLADGTRPGVPIVPVDLAASSITQRAIPLRAALPSRLRRGRREPLDLLRAGILRDLCGLAFHEIAALLGKSRSSVADAVRTHHALVREHLPYATLVASLVELALGRLARRLEHM